MRIGTGRMGLAMLGVVVAAGVVTLAPLPPERGVARAQDDTGNLPQFAVDGVHSSVVFGIKHLGVAYTFGRFNDVSGTFNLDPENLDQSYVSVTIQTDSVDTGNGNRDDHLRSGDFFNTKVFPEATFDSTSIVKKGDGFELTGEMTINGKPKTITVPLELVGQGMGMGKMRAGILAEFTISRSAFGISWRPEAPGDDVRMIVSLEGVLVEEE